MFFGEWHIRRTTMLRILLIEDNDVNQDLIARYLELFECQVTTAFDGPKGLATALAKHTEIDLILLDMNLPKMDGWEVAGRLKAYDRTKHLPLIAVTAHAMVGDREKALAAGCDDYVTKPIDFKILLDKIQSLTCRAFAQ